MKKLILISTSVILISCSNSNKIALKKHEKEKMLADNSNIVCKRSRQTGSRMNSTVCITKAQKERERKAGQEALRRSIIGAKSGVSGSSGK